MDYATPLSTGSEADIQIPKLSNHPRDAEGWLQQGLQLKFGSRNDHLNIVSRDFLGSNFEMHFGTRVLGLGCLQLY